MLNNQPIEARVANDSSNNGDLLSLHSLFRTIQGEGPFSGRRAVFIRLAGCNLQCPQCDTDYTIGRGAVSVVELVRRITRNFDTTWLIVITGGEPFRQNIQPLVQAMIDCGYTVQIETNGVLPLPSIGFPALCSKDTNEPNKCFVVCSPKTNKVHPTIEALACAYKYVLDARNVWPDDGLPTTVLENQSKGIVARPPHGLPVYIQPADERNVVLNNRNLHECSVSALEHGYILQIQLHKTVGME